MRNGSEGIPESSKLAGATTEPEPGVEPNVGEFAVIWNRKSEDERAEMLHNMRVSRDLGERCWFADHERQIAEQRSRIAALEAVIEKVHGVLTDPPLRPATERVIKAVQELRAAPSTVLDQVIREAKADAEAERDRLQQQVHDVCSERVGLEAQIEAVRKYADERAWYAGRNRTVGSVRIASDLFQILGLGPDGKEKP